MNLFGCANARYWTRCRTIIRFILQLIIYGFLMLEFIASVINSTVEYLVFDTMVYVNYHIPEFVSYPAVTICGCTTQNLTCGAHEFELYQNNVQAFHKYSALEILQNQSFPMDGFIEKCNLILDTHQPHNRIPCSALRPVVETYSFGRKCWTFFADSFDKEFVYRSRFSKLKFSSQMIIELNFTTFPLSDYKEPPDVMMALHPPHMIPSILDADFYSLEPYYSYDFQFSERTLTLLPKPWITECHKYHKQQRPRSKHECLDMCIARRTFNNQTKCLNYYGLFNEAILEEAIGKQEARQSKICPDTKNNLDYLRFVIAKSHCEEQCKRDCLHQDYRITRDHTVYIDDSLWGKSIITIWPEQAIAENIVHSKALDLCEYIGFLGGLAHIWLGLSAVQSYDVLVLVCGYVCQVVNRFRNRNIKFYFRK